MASYLFECSGTEENKSEHRQFIIEEFFSRGFDPTNRSYSDLYEMLDGVIEIRCIFLQFISSARRNYIQKMKRVGGEI